MNRTDTQTIACHISVITSNLVQITKYLETNIPHDKSTDMLDRLVDDMHMRLEEIEYTLGIWDEPKTCNCECCVDDDPWYQFDRKQPSDYKMD